MNLWQCALVVYTCMCMMNFIWMCDVDKVKKFLLSICVRVRSSIKRFSVLCDRKHLTFVDLD